MCGIVGKLYFNPQKQVSRNTLEEMCQSLAHRGPDHQGVFTDGNLGLGHRRLSIIDLSEAGNQPMSDNEGRFWLTFNGMIYNFLELKEKLKKEGVLFKSKTDTEVIIYLYKKYGVECLKELRGMFAFALWDKYRRQLFLARDRVGKKPLKYYLDNNVFIFASELKAILKNPEVKKRQDWQAINHYLTYQYVPHPLTGFLNIKKLPPAHYMVVKENGETEIKRYWKLDYSEKWTLPEREWTEKILEKLEEAVKLRMVADVPLGVMLSGGIDSAAVTGLMSSISEKPVKTFTVGFEEKSHNEALFARETAKLFKTEHHEFTVKPDVIQILPKLVYHYEEPYADSSAIPTFYITQQLKNYVKVALGGDGGDENFAGYKRYNFYKLFLFAAKFPKTCRKLFFRQGGKLAAKAIFHNSPREEKALRFLDKIAEPPERAYLQLMSYFTEEQKEKLFTPQFKNQIEKMNSFGFLKEKLAMSRIKEPLDRVLFADFNSYLPDDLLVKTDIAAGANSLELRSPLLDHELLELTAKIPSSLKLKGQKNKYIFKKALKNLLPEETLSRKKMGFGVPIGKWFQKELKDYLPQTLLSKRALQRGLFRKDFIEKLIKQHGSQRFDFSNQLWALLCLEHWFRAYFD